MEKPNEILEINMLIVSLVLSFLVISLILILFFYFSRKKIIKQELAKKDLEIHHQREMLHAVVFTQEEERKRIAQDLHDDISSKLNVVSLNSHLLNTPNLSFEEQQEIVSNIIQLTGKALENSRRIAHDLLPPVLEKFGLNSGIQELVADFNSTKKVIVSYENSISFEDIDFNNQLHIFRILQELLNNSMKHGKPTQISIRFKATEDNKSEIVYEDNGEGFDMKTDAYKNGLGLRNIQSRVDFLKGNYICESSVGNGVKIKIIY